MKHLQTMVMVGLLIFISTFAQADESSLDKAKNGAVELWEKTKTTTSEIVSSASDKAAEIGENSSEIGGKISQGAKETGQTIWDNMKELGAATSDGAKKGVSKIRDFVGDES
ncbi:hypothetical protein [Marinomonas colpomeniae]|nr:hypothetical protein [Marinomonas colpomeniae]